MILELYECDSTYLNNTEYLKDCLVQAATIAQATVVNMVFHEFSPQGITGTLILSESHINIHTWPEYSYAAIDLFTCGTNIKHEAAKDYMIEKLAAQRSTYQIFARGTMAQHCPNDAV